MIFSRRVHWGLTLALVLLFTGIVASIALGTSGNDQEVLDGEGKKLAWVISEWISFAQNVSALPEPYRFTITPLTEDQRRTVAAQKQAAINEKIATLWVSDSPQKERIQQIWMNIGDRLGTDSVRDLGGSIKSFSLERVEIKGDTAVVEATMLIRWAMLQMEPEKRLVVSEEEVVDRFNFRREGAQWKLQSWKQLSPGASGKILFEQRIPDSMNQLSPEIIQKIGI
ncbi:MAG: hypothetical protein QME76_11660 [Bacillota bacterium]|nr:hypothetical protein [Bacillota bacterium]